MSGIFSTIHIFFNLIISQISFSVFMYISSTVYDMGIKMAQVMQHFAMLDWII